MNGSEERWNDSKLDAQPSYNTDHKPLICNVVDGWREDSDGKPHPVKWYRPIDDIGETLRNVTGGWPRVAGGILFVAQKKPDGPAEIRFLSKPAGLFAWLQERCDLRWTNETAISGHDGKSPRSPATKEESFEHLKSSSPKRYIGTSPLPHFPEMPGVYYLPRPREFDGLADDQTTGRLEEFVASLNPATDLDRDLLRCLIVTMAWGGDAGTRPAFVLASDFGRGVGKSATAEAICEIFGGAFTVSPKDKPDDVNKKLMCDSGLAKRCVFMDNLKGRFDSTEFESMLTRKTIDGWRPYVGYYSRPNFLTWIITSNTPKLSEDMAVRSVVIMLGEQQHGKAWVGWASQFIRDHQWEILHDCLCVLRGEPLSRLSPENRDRWQAWQEAILCRCSGRADELAVLLAERRGEVNADAEDAEEIAEAIKDHITEKFGVGGASMVCRFTRDEMWDVLVKAKVWDSDMGVRSLTTRLQNLGGSKSLHPLKSVKTRAKRIWVWNPTGAADEGEIPL